MKKYEELFRRFPDWPKPGVNFVDWLPVMQDPYAFAELLDGMIGLVAPGLKDGKPQLPYTSVVGLESRGFLLGPTLAIPLGLPFIPLRKPHKLPGETLSESYTTEYSVDTLEVQADAAIGTHPLVVDDLAATNGTLLAAQALLKRLGADTVTSLVIFNLTDCPKLPGKLDALYSLIDTQD